MGKLKDIVQVHPYTIHCLDSDVFIGLMQLLFGEKMLIRVHREVEKRIICAFPQREYFAQRVLA
jgi:hypothetical protein